jgi:hypothetical protein
VPARPHGGSKCDPRIRPFVYLFGDLRNENGYGGLNPAAPVAISWPIFDQTTSF